MEERFLEVLKKKKFEVAMTSLQIAEITGKQHSHVMRDIEDESEKLGKEISESIFGLSTYQGARRKEKCYVLSKDGVMQIGMRYDALTRYKMTQRLNELEEKVKVLSDKDNLLLNIIKSNSETDRALALNQYQVEYVKPLEDKIEVLTHVNKLYTSTEIAKELGLKSATELNKLLSDKKIQYKINNTWVLTAKYSNIGYESIKQTVLDNGKVIYDRKFTQIGRDFILNLFKGGLQ